MSIEPVVQFENISKRFVFTMETPQSILEMFISFFARRRRRLERNQNLWAVQDVSFEVYPGEVLGIVGRNGSGKSTLLKLISRILRPDAGRMMINGRTSALLELGAGFHQDLTGRENIFLNASVLGLTQKEIEDRYEDIVDFSELGGFIDMPVKHYSSGMYMRLGFSVAIHVKPDILIVDEILAVGDQQFKTKCIDRIVEMMQEGVTIIIVSHNMSLMRKLCTKLIWLEKGEVRASGATMDVARQYMAHTFTKEGGAFTEKKMAQIAKRSGNGDAEITAVRFLNQNDQEQDSFKTGDSLTVEISYLAHKSIEDPEFGISIYRQDGVWVASPSNLISGVRTGVIEGAGKIRYHVERLPLLPAEYEFTVGIHDGVTNFQYDNHHRAYSIRIAPGGTNELYGLVELPAHWEWEMG
jgi:ABC-type polysaccharide/polyol phosphate transport system ATPase subunit